MAAAVQPPVLPQPPQLTQLEANLCLTREDIIDDSQKTDVHVANYPIANTLFQASLTLLVTTPTQCTGLSLLQYFNTFIDSNIRDYGLLGQVLYKISIPYDVKHTVQVSKKNKIKEKEILVRIMEDLTQLEKQCAPFFFVKDNHGFKNLDEKRPAKWRCKKLPKNSMIIFVYFLLTNF